MLLHINLWIRQPFDF